MRCLDLPSGPGTGPGLTVKKENPPSASVPERPKPEKSSVERQIIPVVGRMIVAPVLLACQISTIASGTTSPAPS